MLWEFGLRKADFGSLKIGVKYFKLFKAKTAINRLYKKRGGSSFALALKIRRAVQFALCQS